MSTSFTRTAGTMGIVSGALWLAFAAVRWLAPLVEERTGEWEGLYALATVLVFGATTLTVVLMIGVHRRLGGLGALGLVGILVAVLGAAASIVAWAFLLWGGLMMVGTALLAIAALSHGGTPRRATAIFGFGWAAGAAAWAVLRGLRVGTADVWGDYIVANATGVTIGAVASAVGLFGLGAWLRSERPATVAGSDNAVPA